MTVPTTLSDEEFGILAVALAARPAWLDLARALETAAVERASDGLRVLSIAFVYDLVPPSQEGRRETAGSPYPAPLGYPCRELAATELLLGLGIDGIGEDRAELSPAHSSCSGIRTTTR